MMDIRRIAQRLVGSVEPYGLISAFVKGADANENEKKHTELLQEVAKLGLPHREYLGRWEGSREKSVAVKGITPETLSNLGRKYEQEVVVYVTDGCRKLIRLKG